VRLVKFINSHPDHRGNVLYINPEHVISLREDASVQGGSLSTRIYVGYIEFTVEESLKEALNILMPPISGATMLQEKYK
jgi:hypothetical protein